MALLSDVTATSYIHFYMPFLRSLRLLLVLTRAALSRLEFKRSNKVHRAEITGLAVDEGGNTLYTVSKDSCLKLHNLDGDEQLHSVQIGDLALSSCLPGPSGKVSLS